MNILEWISPKKPCKKFDSHETLFLGLQNTENDAILCLQTKTITAVRRIVSGYGLSGNDAEDILNRSTMIFLQKIQEGAYLFQGYAPATYLIEIAKRLALMTTRSQKKHLEPLDNYQHLPDDANFAAMANAWKAIRPDQPPRVRLLLWTNARM